MGNDWDDRQLEPGDRVWFDGYGNGLVESVSQVRLVIVWELAGRLTHDPSFARWLKPAQP